MMDRFNFVAFEVNTFEDFTFELDYQSTLFSFKNDNQEIGLSFIFQSMTKNQRDIVKIIAQHQLDNPQDKGITMKDLMIKCVD